MNRTQMILQAPIFQIALTLTMLGSTCTLPGALPGTAPTNAAAADLRADNFDADPKWEKFGETASGAPAKLVTQDFGWRDLERTLGGGTQAGGRHV